MSKVVALDAEDISALNAYLIRGLNYRQVYEETGVSRGRLRNLLLRDDVKRIMDELFADFKVELNNLAGEALQVIRDGFRNPDMNVRLQAYEKWSKSIGLYSQTVNVSGVSAEDIARKLASGEFGEAEMVGSAALPMPPGVSN